jgi:hypothetical protein
MTWRCFKERPATCRKCDAETRVAEERRQRDHELELEREAKQREYAKQLADLQTEIAYQRRLLKDQSDQKQRDQVISQHRKDLADLTTAASRINIQPNDIEPAPHRSKKGLTEINVTEVADDRPSQPQPAPQKDDEGCPLDSQSSPAIDEWEHQKEFEGAANDALDSLIKMIGLEDVKQQFLSIKAKVDTVIRQGTHLKDERFGAAFLGNPGTGKIRCSSPKSDD